MTDRHEVCPVTDLPPGERQIIDIDGESIGMFNVDGEFYALKNVCPHHLAPLCEGTVTGTVAPSNGVGEYEWEKEGEVIRCPWHKWEFDITSGESVYNPHRLRTRTYETRVEARTGSAGEDHGCIGDTDAKADADAGTGEATNGDETELLGNEPPVETFETSVERDMVVVYI